MPSAVVLALVDDRHRNAEPPQLAGQRPVVEEHGRSCRRPGWRVRYAAVVATWTSAPAHKSADMTWQMREAGGAGAGRTRGVRLRVDLAIARAADAGTVMTPLASVLPR